MEWFILTLFAAFFFGVRQVISKKVLLYEHANEYLTVSSMLVFLFSLFFLPKMSLDYSWNLWLLIYIKSFILTVGWLLGAKALRHLEISLMAPMTNLTPVFLLIWGFFFLHEVPSALQYAGVALLIFGAYWLQADHHLSSLIRPWKIFKNKFSIFVIIAIFIYSICAAMDKVILMQMDPYTFLASTYFILSIHFLIVQFVKYEGLKDIKHAFIKGKHLMFVIALLLLFTDIFYLMAVAIPGAMISLIIPVKRMSTLIATIIGGRVFHDHNLIYRIVACAIMVVGVILVVI